MDGSIININHLSCNRNVNNYNLTRINEPLMIYGNITGRTLGNKDTVIGQNIQCWDFSGQAPLRTLFDYFYD